MTTCLIATIGVLILTSSIMLPANSKKARCLIFDIAVVIIASIWCVYTIIKIPFNPLIIVAIAIAAVLAGAIVKFIIDLKK